MTPFCLALEVFRDLKGTGLDIEEICQRATLLLCSSKEGRWRRGDGSSPFPSSVRAQFSNRYFRLDRQVQYKLVRMFLCSFSTSALHGKANITASACVCLQEGWSLTLSLTGQVTGQGSAATLFGNPISWDTKSTDCCCLFWIFPNVAILSQTRHFCRGQVRLSQSSDGGVRLMVWVFAPPHNPVDPEEFPVSPNGIIFTLLVLINIGENAKGFALLKGNKDWAWLVNTSSFSRVKHRSVQYIRWNYQPSVNWASKTQLKYQHEFSSNNL